MLIAQETTIVSFPEIDWSRARLSMKEQVDLRRFLRAKQHFLANQDRVFELWVTALCNVFGGIVGELPVIADDDRPDPDRPAAFIAVRAGRRGEQDHRHILRRPLINAGLFTEFQKRTYENQCRVSKCRPLRGHEAAALFPPDDCELPAREA